jgi:hypothetical protein
LEVEGTVRAWSPGGVMVGGSTYNDYGIDTRILPDMKYIKEE